jgi:hypothetical protein
VADLVRGGGNPFQSHWRALGHFLAHVHWAGQLLDARAHPDSVERRAGGYRLRLHDSDDDIWRRCGGAERVGEDLGIPRTARGVHRGMGLRGDADVGAVRQLVAQRLWAGSRWDRLP